ncbi:Hypp1202 [Branchiostoma lanceolatum]|uniref:Hypp1202 protein n=1 Tax=Branchiostoma lanceolatum TaxID=7740 RepID=A0A8K0EMF0_BRALA|nr:Hypp1202 [Branchiostoma lanceolatum]
MDRHMVLVFVLTNVAVARVRMDFTWAQSGSDREGVRGCGRKAGAPRRRGMDRLPRGSEPAPGKQEFFHGMPWLSAPWKLHYAADKGLLFTKPAART